jgi:hypothetical protein
MTPEKFASILHDLGRISRFRSVALANAFEAGEFYRFWFALAHTRKRHEGRDRHDAKITRILLKYEPEEGSTLVNLFAPLRFAREKMWKKLTPRDAYNILDKEFPRLLEDLRDLAVTGEQ